MLLKDIVSSGRNNRGMTLLEVMMTLAIFGIIAVAFISFYTDISIGITYSGRRIDATLEAKSILNEIGIKIKENENGKIKEEITALLNEYDNNDGQIIENISGFYEYRGKKIHCFINLMEENSIKIRDEDSKEIISSKNLGIKTYKIRILNFYDNGKRKVELTNYVSLGDNRNE